MPRTELSWKRSACLPKRATKRRTVLRLTPHSRAVARQPWPSARCLAMATSLSSAVRRPNRGVLVRWGKFLPQLLQRKQRMLLPRSDQPCGCRLAPPRWPWAGQSRLGQATCAKAWALIATPPSRRATIILYTTGRGRMAYGVTTETPRPHQRAERSELARKTTPAIPGESLLHATGDGPWRRRT